MKKVLNYLFEHRTLTREDARQILVSIGKGEYNEHELSAFMTVYLMRSITLDELMGFRDALLELSVSIDFQHRQVMDVVGTGGDGKNTFNISTLACFIIAGAGFPVAKHGNYGASSISGASNLMERIGYVFKNDQDALRKELDASNMCFLHAPFFHPALKTVGPIRKNLKVRTFFNLLGPVVNPSRPAFQLIGVYNLEIARLYNYLLQSENSTFAIVHSLDGYDEISLTADSKVITKLGEKVYHPNALGGMVVRPDEIYGGETVDAAVEKFMCILQGKGTASQNAVVCSNAAMGLMLSGKFQDYQSAFESAKDSLLGGKAHAALKKLIQLQ
ncbi:MAG: anthranilate phosphoribosyltransferase [Bacteroidota bacterium]|jgi:anthranilate phosphoribosyltransferase|nr:anthranilate phosphoribosyltransferase [Chitinophagaceae bacterium]